MAIKYGNNKKTASGKLKLTVSVIAGLAVLFVAGKLWSWSLAPLLAWDTAALIYILWVWGVVHNMDGHETAEHALREDPSKSIADSILLVASVASLAAVAVVLGQAQNAQGAGKGLLILLGVVSVVAAWWLVHTVFALRYAELYYVGSPGGVEFDGTSRPSYHDFAYLAFTVGMTFQVSDTGFKSTEFRRTALHHALISYLFGTVIVATTINLIAGLTK